MKTFVPPTQARSLRTYEALLDAASEVLSENSFEHATLSEIASRAGVTVGAFYARFASKEALLEHLEQRIYTRLEAEAEAVTAAHEGEPLKTIVRAFMRMLADLYANERGVIRALVVRSRNDPAMRARRKEFNDRVLGTAIDDLLTRHAQISHPMPGEALRLAWLFASAALREAILFDEYYPAAIEREELVDELTRAVVAYLAADA